MKQLLIFLWVLAGPAALAQGPALRGRVADSQQGGLPSASVLLLQPRDSSAVLSTLTDAQGWFGFSAVGEGPYLLKVTFVGYAPHLRPVTVPAGTDTLDLGTVELRPVAIQLEEVTITVDREPVVIRGDTVEYNAASFGTQPNANLEQLLKRLPGLEVGADGNVSVQGEALTRIFVDGKEVFGGNLQMATKNLPADAIDKVQVVEGRSEESRFSGIDDGRREKVINVTLKEDRRNMGFGKATAGVGTDRRYAAQGNYNRLDGGNLLSVMGSSNNVNNLDLTGNAPGNERGGSSRGRSGAGAGLLTTHSGGATAFYQLAPKTSLNANYLLNQSDADVANNLTRQNFQPEGTAFYYEQGRQRNRSGQQNGFAALERRDSLRTFRLSTNFNYNNTRTAGFSRRQSYSVADTLVNEGERRSQARNRSGNLNANLFYGHRFGRKGRLFTANAQLSGNRDDADGESASFTRFTEGTQEDLRQQNTQDNTGLNLSAELAYTEPLGRKQYLEVSYRVANQATRSDLAVYDVFDEGRAFNPEQSSRFGSRFGYQQAGLTYRLARGKLNASAGAEAQFSTLTGAFGAAAEGIRRDFRNVLPNLTLNGQLNKSTRIGFSYQTTIREPAIDQLQPVLSRYDPLNQYVGNPALRPEYVHQGRLTFHTLRKKSGLLLAGTLNLGYATNPITASVTIDELQVRTTQYVNVKERRSLSAFVNLSLPVKKINGRFNLSPYWQETQSVNLLNGEAGTVNQRTAGGHAGYTYRYKQYVDVSVRANLAVTASRYALNAARNQLLFNTGYTGEARVHFFKRFSATGELYFTKFVYSQAGTNQLIPICNFYISTFLLKGNRAEARLSAFNVLNRNVGVSQTANLNYVEQSTQNALGGFYLLSFTYNINKQR